MYELLILAAITVYWFANGATEGFMHASEERKKANKLIKLRRGEGRGVLGYHQWRHIENLALPFLFLIGLLGKGIAYPNELYPVLPFVGAWIFGWTLYDVTFSYVRTGKLISPKSDYYWWKWKIPFSKLSENMTLLLEAVRLGIAIIVFF